MITRLILLLVQFALLNDIVFDVFENIKFRVKTERKSLKILPHKIHYLLFFFEVKRDEDL